MLKPSNFSCVCPKFSYTRGTFRSKCPLHTSSMQLYQTKCRIEKMIHNWHLLWCCLAYTKENDFLSVSGNAREFWNTIENCMIIRDWKKCRLKLSYFFSAYRKQNFFHKNKTCGKSEPVIEYAVKKLKQDMFSNEARTLYCSFFTSYLALLFGRTYEQCLLFVFSAVILFIIKNCLELCGIFVFCFF